MEYLGVDRIQEHVIAIKDACVSVFRKDDQNKTRIASFKPLKALLRLDLQRMDADALEIATLADKYLQEYTVGGSKLSQTRMNSLAWLCLLLLQL